MKNAQQDKSRVAERTSGDPLDALILMDEAVAIGCVVPARLIGVLEAEQTETSGKNVSNDRLVAVIETEYNPPACRSIDQLPEQRLAEIEHFFVSYNQMEGRDFRWLARRGPAQAAEVVENGIRRFSD